MTATAQSETGHEIPHARAIFDTLVNAQRAALGAQQAAVMMSTAFGLHRVQAIHGVAKIEHSSPYPVWLRQLAKSLAFDHKDEVLDAGSPNAPSGWSLFAPTYLLKIPLSHSFWASRYWLLFKNAPWTPAEIERAKKIADLATQELQRPQSRPDQRRRWGVRGAIALAFCLVAAIPIRLTSIAPAEIVASEPQIIASAYPAVVRRILVSPNETVEKDQILVELDDADQLARLQIAKREFEVATAELRRLTQLGFQDQANRNRLAEVQGQVQIKQLLFERAELDLQRSKLRAPIAGIAIVNDPTDWSGRPVQTGEKILSVADPAQTRVRLWVPAKDGSLLRPGLTGDLYLDSAPWRAEPIEITSWSFEAEQSPFGVIAFRALAVQEAGSNRHTLLGLHGTVHLAGTRIPLLLYLLRRPIIFMRQLLVV